MNRRADHPETLDSCQAPRVTSHARKRVLSKLLIVPDGKFTCTCFHVDASRRSTFALSNHFGETAIPGILGIRYKRRHIKQIIRRDKLL